MATRVTILGATGSIGRSALDVVRSMPGRFEVVGLAAGSNASALNSLIDEFRPRFVGLSDEAACGDLQSRQAAVLKGPDGIVELAAQPVDVVLCGIVGAAGLRAVLSAVESGNRIALANKEPLVMAGELIMGKARERDVRVLPVDSEHNAIFQCLEGHSIEDVRTVHLTASGGPFYRKTREELRLVRPEHAVKHPTWDMGSKISVDSATLMNKGLEVIEAMHLFGLALEKINVVIHPQSIVHSLVEFIDGSILAQLGVTDMRLPIQFALTWPERVKSPIQRLDLTSIKAITFASPDFSEFPCLSYAFEAARLGGTGPAILNAANEVAVEAFCRGRIPFLRIAEVVREVLEAAPISRETSLDGVLDADRCARIAAEMALNTAGAKLA